MSTPNIDDASAANKTKSDTGSRKSPHYSCFSINEHNSFRFFTNFTSIKSRSFIVTEALGILPVNHRVQWLQPTSTIAPPIRHIEHNSSCTFNRLSIIAAIRATRIAVASSRLTIALNQQEISIIHYTSAQFSYRTSYSNAPQCLEVFH